MQQVDRRNVKGGKRRGPADTATLRPVNPQVQTRSGAPAKFRQCANSGRAQVQQIALTEVRNYSITALARASWAGA